MPTASYFLAWLTAHAALLLALSVTITVGGELLRRRADHAGSATSMAAGLAYLVAKGVVSKGLMFGVALAVYRHRLSMWTGPARTCGWECSSAGTSPTTGSTVPSTRCGSCGRHT